MDRRQSLFRPIGAFLLWAALFAPTIAAATNATPNLCPRLLAGTAHRDRWLTRVPTGNAVLIESLAGRADFIPGLPSRAWVDAHRKHLRRGLIVDAETIGLVAPIPLEVALLPFLYDTESGRVVAVEEPYVGTEDPGVALPAITVNLTGLTDAAVHQTRFDRERIHREFEAADLVLAHNAEFDRPIFDRLIPISSHRPWACSLKDVAWYRKGFPSRSLESLVLRHGFWEPSHRALADARQTLRLLSTIDPLTTAPYLAELRQSAYRQEWEIAVEMPYAYRAALKQRGYQWDRRRGLWTLNVPAAEGETRQAAELVWYEGERAQGSYGFRGLSGRLVTARERYRSDVLETPLAEAAPMPGLLAPQPLPPRAPKNDAGQYVLRRLEPLRDVNPDAVSAWERLHPKAIPVLLLRAVSTGRDRESDSLVEIAAIPMLVDEVTGERIAAANPYHGFAKPNSPLAASAQDRLALNDTVLAERAFDLPLLHRWLAHSRYVVAYDAADERPWIDQLLPVARGKTWLSLKDDISWSARGEVKTFFEPIFARNGFFVEGPDALNLATGLYELFRKPDEGTASPLLEALQRGQGVYVRVAVETTARDAGDYLRTEGLKFHRASRRWERLVPVADVDRLVRRLREQLPVGARVVGELIQPHERYQER